MKNLVKSIVRHSLAISVITSIVYSCTSNVQTPEEVPFTPVSNKIPITISGQILQASVHSRTNGNSFEDNDAIGLYVLLQPETLSGKRHVDNIKFTYSSVTGFTSEEDIYYPQGNGACDFISCYPYQNEGIIQETNTIKISVCPDQNTAKGYGDSDFMVAQTNNVTPSKKAINLQHNHKLCQLNLVLQLQEKEDIDLLQQNASITINNLNTQGLYNIETEIFTNLSNPLTITPNGDWIKDEENNQLKGKKALIIPQTGTDCELTLQTGNNKTYITHIPADLILESGTSCELLLIYDSRVGIQGITSSIGDWHPGNSGNATFEEQEENKVIQIANLNFNKSNVYTLSTSQNIIIGEICKEYLRNEDINSQAIVLYTEKEKNKGIILQLLGNIENVHGGNITWDTANNSFTYQAGSTAPIKQIYVSNEGNITFEEGDKLQDISVTEKILTDIRGNETISYPIVKIGTQYWMRENLSATKYNDGGAITNNSSQLKNASAGYCYINKNYFYNKTSVISGKLIPKGWKIPNEAEWNLLKSYIHDESAVLKANKWDSSSEITEPNNLSDFNGIAIGSYYGTSVPVMLKGTSQYVSYWKVGNTQTSLSDFGITLNYQYNEIKGAKYSDYCAYAIRCIQE